MVRSAGCRVHGLRYLWFLDSRAQFNSCGAWVYLLFSTWSSLVAQSVKNLPAMQGTRLPAAQEKWVQSLGQEDPLEKEMATHSSILAWKIPCADGSWWVESVGLQESDMT